MLVTFTDTAVDRIERDVAAHPAERGGALLGPVGRSTVTRFLFDPEAAVSGASYRASRQLTEAVQAIELEDATIEFKGVLHSHPGSLDRPSGQDHIAFGDSLRLTPWLGRLLGPIVTRGHASLPHELGLPSGKMSCFLGEPANGREARVSPIAARVVPIGSDLRWLTQALDGELIGDVGHMIHPTWGVLFGGGVAVHGGAFTYLVTEDYPAVPPIVMVDKEDGSVEQPWVKWVVGADHIDRLMLMEGAIKACLPGRAAAVVAASPLTEPEALVLAEASDRVGTEMVGGSLCEGQFDSGNIKDTEPSSIPESPKSPWWHRWSRSRRVRVGIQARLGAVLPSPLVGRSVVVVGAGSVGSQAAEALVRAGVEHLWVIDPDRVEPANLSRTVYTARDLGHFKVRALRCRLRRINPAVEVVVRAERLEELGEADLREMLDQVDLVFSSADDPLTQYHINHWAYAHGVPAVYVGIYAKGHGGEVVVAIPGLTRCYRCAVPTRTQTTVRGTDYGTGRLVAEPALGADISHVTTAGVKAAVAILASSDPHGPQAQWLLDSLGEPDRPRSYMITSTVPRYSFFPEVFGATPGQGPYQTVWMSPDGSDDCPVCGSKPMQPVMTEHPELGSLVADTRPGRPPTDLRDTRCLQMPCMGTHPCLVDRQ